MEGKIIVVKRKGKTNANKKGKKDGGGGGGNDRWKRDGAEKWPQQLKGECRWIRK